MKLHITFWARPGTHFTCVYHSQNLKRFLFTLIQFLIKWSLQMSKTEQSDSKEFACHGIIVKVNVHQISIWSENTLWKFTSIHHQDIYPWSAIRISEILFAILKIAYEDHFTKGLWAHNWIRKSYHISCNSMTDDPIRSQMCTCHSKWAAMVGENFGFTGSLYYYCGSKGNMICFQDLNNELKNAKQNWCQNFITIP